MKFQCLSESCGKLFVYPAKKVQPTETTEGNTAALAIGLSPTFTVAAYTETHVCPYCHSPDIEEYIPTPLPQPTEEIGNVYIYELTTGPQTGLDVLLAQGYKIVGRSVKLYQLEKPKAPKPEQKELVSIIREGIAEAKQQ